MKPYRTSIFNDVIGPIMTGPSSSHTAGPGRIGYVCGSLLQEVTEIKIIFPKESSYGATYLGQGSAMGFVGGILGYSIAEPDFKRSLEIARERNIPVSFLFEDCPCPHPNTAYLHLTDGKNQVYATTFSTGGGTMEVVEINGTKVSIKGDAYLLGLFSSEEKSRTEAVSEDFFRQEALTYDKLSGPEGELSLYQIYAPPACGLLDRWNRLLTGHSARAVFIPPVLPVVDTGRIETPFLRASELQAFLREKPMRFYEAAVLYECRRSGWKKEEVLAFTDRILTIIEDSIHFGMTHRPERPTFWKPAAAELKQAVEKGRILDLGILNYAHAYATAIMEANSCKGIVVAGPTAGSCGVLGGLLFSMRDTTGCDRQKMIEAVLVAGLIGVFISEQATFGAEVAACQAENGSASCMAAGAAAWLLGGTNEEILNAANLAMQNMLGLVCDPVAGCAAIPCINRNSSSIANAAICANLAVGGYDPVIPFDQTIQAMYDVGRMLPRELRCTGLGGLCSTRVGQEISRTCTYD